MDIMEYRKQTEQQKDTVWKQFKELKEAVLAYKECVRLALYGDVFEKLANLLKDMEGCDDKFAGRLEEIMLQFGMQEVRPQKGDCLDYNFHDRANRKDEGMIITECVCRGWKYDDQKLLAAIVRTDETAEGGENNEQ